MSAIPQGGAPAPGETPRRPRRKLLLAGGVVLAALAALLAVAWIQGTWANRAELDPADPSQGILTQLWLTPENRKVVRCAMVADHPVEKVWGLVTGYARFAETFPMLADVRTASEPDGRHRLECKVTSPLGSWPVNVRILHKESPDRRVASWDEPTGNVVVNRGSWTLIPAGPQRTLVVYVLDVEVSPFPDFLVRAVLLSRQKTVLEALARALGAARA